MAERKHLTIVEERQARRRRAYARARRRTSARSRAASEMKAGETARGRPPLDGVVPTTTTTSERTTSLTLYYLPPSLSPFPPRPRSPSGRSVVVLVIVGVHHAAGRTPHGACYAATGRVADTRARTERLTERRFPTRRRDVRCHQTKQKRKNRGTGKRGGKGGAGRAVLAHAPTVGELGLA